MKENLHKDIFLNFSEKYRWQYDLFSARDQFQ